MSEKISLVLCLMIVLLLPFNLFVQNSGNDTIPKVQQTGDPAVRILNSVAGSAWKPTTSVFPELLGKGWYSVNIDFRKKVAIAVSFGIQVAEEECPSEMYYRFSGKRHRFEKGGGLSGIIDNGFERISVHRVIGDRYQKKDGLLFRAGFTPIVGIPFREIHLNCARITSNLFKNIDENKSKETSFCASPKPGPVIIGCIYNCHHIGHDQ